MSGFSRWVTRDRRIPLPTEWQFPFAGSCFAATRMVGFVVGNEREIAASQARPLPLAEVCGKRDGPEADREVER